MYMQRHMIHLKQITENIHEIDEERGKAVFFGCTDAYCKIPTK